MEAEKGTAYRERRRLAVLTYAKEHGYVDVEYRGKWNGFDVWHLVFTRDKKIRYIGVPTYVLDDGKSLRIADNDESFAIMDSLI